MIEESDGDWHQRALVRGHPLWSDEQEKQADDERRELAYMT